MREARAGDPRRFEDDAVGGALEDDRDLVLVVVEFPRHIVAQSRKHIVPVSQFGEPRIIGERARLGVGQVAQAEFRQIHPHVMDKVGSLVALDVGSARPDVVGIRRAIVANQLLLEGSLLRGDRVFVAVVGFLQHAQTVGVLLCHVKHFARIAKRGGRAIANLLVMGLRTVGRANRRDVERNRAVAQAERIHPRIEFVELALDALGLGADFGEFVDRAAVDPRQGAVLEHFIELGLIELVGVDRQQRIGRHPVDERPVAAAHRPLAVAEGARIVFIEIAAAAAVVAPSLARRQINAIGRRLRQLRRRLGELRLLVVVDVDGRIGHHHLSLRHRPTETRIANQAIPPLQRREIVSVRIAMPLRIEHRRLLFAEHGLLGAFDVVVDRVGNLAGRDALGEIPQQTIVVRRHRDDRRRFARASAQERELFVQE